MRFNHHLTFLAFLSTVCISAAEPNPSELLIVEIGTQDATAASSWCQDGRRLVQALSTDVKVVATTQASWDKAGLQGRVNICLVPDFKHLPFASRLIDVVVVEDWAKVNPAEIARVVIPRGRVIVRQGGENAKSDLYVRSKCDSSRPEMVPNHRTQTP